MFMISIFIMVACSIVMGVELFCSIRKQNTHQVAAFGVTMVLVGAMLQRLQNGWAAFLALVWLAVSVVALLLRPEHKNCNDSEGFWTPVDFDSLFEPDEPEPEPEQSPAQKRAEYIAEFISALVEKGFTYGEAKELAEAELRNSTPAPEPAPKPAPTHTANPVIVTYDNMDVTDVSNRPIFFKEGRILLRHGEQNEANTIGEFRTLFSFGIINPLETIRLVKDGDTITIIKHHPFSLWDDQHNLGYCYDPENSATLFGLLVRVQCVTLQRKGVKKNGTPEAPLHIHVRPREAEVLRRALTLMNRDTCKWQRINILGPFNK